MRIGRIIAIALLAAGTVGGYAHEFRAHRGGCDRGCHGRHASWGWSSPDDDDATPDASASK